MKEYWTLKELTDALMEELSERIGAGGVRRLLKSEGFDAKKLEAMGFSQSLLSNLGFEIE